MKKSLLVMLIIALLNITIYAQNSKIQDYAQKGGQVVTINGLSSSSKFQQSFPNCTITVYNGGTTTLSSIYSDTGGTPKANPFTSNSDASFEFYGSSGTTYDVRFSGTGITTPFTVSYVGGTPSNLFSDPTTTRGDIIYRNSSNVVARLGIGSIDTFLGSNGTDLSYRNTAKIYDKGGLVYNVKAFGAFGDGSSHPLSGVYSTLAAAQVDYPLAQSLADEFDTVAIEKAINIVTDAAQVYVPAGRYRINRTINIGDGTSAGRATKNRFCSLIGAGFGQSSDETLPEGGATEFYWYGSAGGTVISVNGPIGGIRIEGIYAHLKASTNAANTFLALHHVNNSTFKRLLATHYSGLAYIIDAYPDGAAGSTADGADDNKWEQVFADHGEAGGKGIQIGASSVAGGILNVARNTWDRCYFEGDLELRYADSSTFVDSAAGTLKVIPPTGNNGFPSAIILINSPMAVDDTSGGSWTNSNPLFFWPHPTGDITSIPNATWALGVTYTGKFFGTGWAFTGTAPSLSFTDTTASAKSLTVAVDANKANFRESAGAAGSLLTLDLALNRVGVGTNSPSRLFHISASALPGFEVEITGAQKWFFYAGAGTASGAGFSVFDDTQLLDRLTIDAVTGNVVVLQKLGVGLAVNATPTSKLEVAGDITITGGKLISGGLLFANLGTTANSIVYCTDCKNVATDGAAAGSVAANAGTGTFVFRVNGAWRIFY